MSIKEISANIKNARQNAGLSQEAAASFLNVTPQKISSFETGRTRIDVETLALLCGLYQVDSNRILCVSSDCPAPYEELKLLLIKNRDQLSNEEKIELARILFLGSGENNSHKR